MSSGKQHWESNKRLLVAGAVAVSITTMNPFYAFAWMCGVTTGMLVHPDWDINHRTYPNRMVKNKFGSIIASIYWYVQYPYAMLIPHRSWVSHTPIVSTIIRMAYVGVWLIPLALLLGTDIIMFMLMTPFTFISMVGWFTTDLNHILMDKFN